MTDATVTVPSAALPDVHFVPISAPAATGAIVGTRRDPDPSTGRGSRRRRIDAGRIVIGALVAAALGGAGFFGFQWAEYTRRHVVARAARLDGAVAELGTRLDGRVAVVLVDAGDRVEAGDVLARIDAAHLDASLARAKAEQAEAESRHRAEKLAIDHARARLVARLDEAADAVGAAASRVVAATAEAEWRAREADRYAAAGDSRAATAVEIDRARAAAEVAEAGRAAAAGDLEVARARARFAEAELVGLVARDAHLDTLAARITSARTAVGRAEADRAASAIVAPRAGRVVGRIVEAGASVRVGQPIVALWLDEDVWVDAWFAEDDLPNLEVGGAASVTVAADGSDAVVGGRIAAIYPASGSAWERGTAPADARGRFGGGELVRVRVELGAPIEGAFPGLTADVAVVRPAAREGGR